VQTILNGYVMHADRGIKNLVIGQYELGRGEETSNLLTYSMEQSPS
jgi:hypothetical protein